MTSARCTDCRAPAIATRDGAPRCVAHAFAPGAGPIVPCAPAVPPTEDAPARAQALRRRQGIVNPTSPLPERDDDGDGDELDRRMSRAGAADGCAPLARSRTSPGDLATPRTDAPNDGPSDGSGRLVLGGFHRHRGRKVWAMLRSHRGHASLLLVSERDVGASHVTVIPARYLERFRAMVDRAIDLARAEGQRTHMHEDGPAATSSPAEAD